MPLVERTQDVLHGAPRIAGTRIYAASVIRAIRADTKALSPYAAYYRAGRQIWTGLPELTAEDIDHLLTFPLPEWKHEHGDYTFWLDERDGDPGMSNGMDDFDLDPATIPALIVALQAAYEAHQHWEQSVAAWLTTEQRAEREGIDQ